MRCNATTHLLGYRANLPPQSFVADPPALPPVQVPVLGVWSSGDRALCEHQMTNSAAYCEKGFTYVRLEGFEHWLPIEAAKELTDSIIEFSSRGD